MSLYLFYIPCPNLETAKDIANKLVQSDIAICCNIINNITSIYKWKDNIQEDTEILLLAKVTDNNRETAQEYIKSVHPYGIPCIAGIKIDNINSEYLNWAL